MQTTTQVAEPQELSDFLFDNDSYIEWLEGLDEFHRLQDFENWLDNVRSRPDLYNFVHEVLTCDGCGEPERVNDWGRCESCQNALEVRIQAAEDSGWLAQISLDCR